MKFLTNHNKIFLNNFFSFKKKTFLLIFILITIFNLTNSHDNSDEEINQKINNKIITCGSSLRITNIMTKFK